MKLECMASALNLRSEPKGSVVAEMRLGDLIEVAAEKSNLEWISGVVATGVSIGRKGFVRRKWLIQHFEEPPGIAARDRSKAGEIVAQRSLQFDAVVYHLGSKAKTWQQLKSRGYVDCSGWVYLLGKEILAEYGLSTAPSVLDTYSDDQIVKVGGKTKCILSGRYVDQNLFQPGVIVGIDFAEYSWDRGRPLDIDHIVAVGRDASGPFISQSSSSGGGVNRVSLAKWLGSTQSLIGQGRVHLVDLLSLP